MRACALNRPSSLPTFSMQLGGGILPTVHLRIVCIKAEQKNTKQNNRTWLEGLLTITEYQHFLEEGKLVVGVASVMCIVTYRYPIFMIFGIMQEYCRRLLVLPDTSMYSTFS